MRIRKSKKGFTLLEVLVAVGLLAIASVAIGSMLISSQKNSSRVMTQTELQQQLTQTQENLHNEILATNAGIKYWTRDSDADPWELTQRDNGTEKDKVIAFYNLNQADYVLTKTYYWYDSDEQILKVGSMEQQIEKNTENSQTIAVDPDLDLALEAVEKWDVGASSLESMSFDTTGYSQNQLLSFYLNVESEEHGKSYNTEDTVFMRNTISINDDLKVDEFHTIQIEMPTLAEGANDFIYDTTEHSPTEVNYLDRFVTRTADSVTSATNAGVYTITYSLKDKDSTQWTDGTTGDITLTWTIKPKELVLLWGDTQWDYDGQVHSTTAEIRGVYESDTVNLTLTNNSVGPNAGEVVCNAVIDNTNYKLPPNYSVVLKITSIDASADIDIVNRTYNGKSQSMVNVKNVVGNAVYFYISEASQTPAAGVVTSTTCTALNAGTYYIWYRVEPDANSHGGEVTYLGKAIMSRQPAATVTTKNFTYDGKTKTGVTGQFIQIVSGQASAKNAGEYTVMVEPDRNHLWADTKDASTKQITWTISPAESKLTPPTPISGLVYNKAPQALIRPGSTNSGTMYYKLEGGKWSRNVPTATDAGTYKVYYYVKGGANYNDTPQNAYITAEIQPRPESYVHTADKIFNGTVQTGYSAANLVDISGYYAASSAGTHTFTATPQKNYCWEDSPGDRSTRTFKWTIHPGSANLTHPIGIERVYNGKAQSIVFPGSSESGTLMYKLGRDGTYSTRVPTATAAGKYTIYYYVKGDANHNDSKEFSITSSILPSPTASVEAVNRIYNGKEQIGVIGENVVISGKKSATAVGTYSATVVPKTNYAWEDGTRGRKTITWKITEVTASFTPPTALTNLVYNGKAQQLIKPGYTQDGTIMYKLEGDSWSESIPTGTNAGTYKVYYYVKGDENHKDSATKTIQVKISRRPSAEYEIIATDMDYTGNAVSPKIEGTHINKTGDIKATNIGTYTITLTPAKNYAWEDGTYGPVDIEWTISASFASIATPPKALTLTYTGKAQSLIKAGTANGGVIYYKVNNGGTPSTYSTSLPKATNAGTYTVTYYVKGQNGFIDSKTQTISVIIKRSPTASFAVRNVTYNGITQSGISKNNYAVISSNSTTTAIYPGTFKIYATPDSNHSWSDGTTTMRTFTWKILPSNTATFEYPDDVYFTGRIVRPVMKGSHVTWSGTKFAMALGTYSMTVTPRDGYAWKDGTTDSVTVNWRVVTNPSAKFTLTNNGESVYTGDRVGIPYQGENVLLTGTLYAVNTGTYTAYVQPKDGFCWPDGGTEKITVKWKIVGRNEATFSVSGLTEFTYDGSAKTISIRYNRIVLSGKLSATDAGTYTVSAVPTDGYCWSDTGTDEERSVSWKINRARTATASAVNRTYNGSSQTGVTGSYVTWRGTTKATNAANYTAIATPDANHAWSDGSTTAKTINWSIAKARTASVTTSNKTYNGKTQTGVTGKNVTFASGSQRTGINAGTYRATATPNSNYAWSDGTSAAKSFSWVINRARTATVKAYGYRYSLDSSKTVGVTGTNVTLSGTTSSTGAGIHKAYATPKANYAWSDGSYGRKTVIWVRGDKAVSQGYGNSSTQVKNVQNMLNALGYNAGTADGICGSGTVAAIKRFQKAYGLTADGVLGYQGYPTLLVAYAKHQKMGHIYPTLPLTFS